jgi:hypothetical protein
MKQQFGYIFAAVLFNSKEKVFQVAGLPQSPGGLYWFMILVVRGVENGLRLVAI